ncbi:MAG TPA: BON domain-containing protein [Verrucomicrobiae bacterium]|nr:BON domain-containing protein [Verrucomicrobiae bacterium]
MKMTHLTAFAVITGAILVSAAPVRASSQDDRIEDSAKQSYNFKTYLKNDRIHVKSRDGVVTLTGSVADDSQKAVAADTVANLPGVVSVNNELKVKGAAMTEHSDGWIAFKVKSELLFHKNVSATDTTVNVHDGVVTITGNATSQAQKDLTSEYAHDVDGVRGVNNQMVVGGAPVEGANRPIVNNGGAPVVESAGAQGTVVTSPNSLDRTGETTGQKIDDASITAQVKAALLAHRSTSAVNTKVKTVDGVVTLTGVARNAAEKDLVTKFVSDINGVRSINNEMTTESSQ